MVLPIDKEEPKVPFDIVFKLDRYDSTCVPAQAVVTVDKIPSSVIEW